MRKSAKTSVIVAPIWWEWYFGDNRKKGQVISKTFEHDLAFLIIPEDYWDRDFLFLIGEGGMEREQACLLGVGSEERP